MRDRERGFMEVARQEPGYRPVRERLLDFNEVERRLTDEELHEQAARCMDCGIPFCHAAGCPVRNVIPEFNDLAYHGRWREALDVLLDGGCFPEFTGRICPAPCEGSCVLGLNREPVAIRLIELAIIERAFAEGYMTPRLPATRHDGRVAVIGSGPCGLAAAHTLNRQGYYVTVFEHAAHPGGLLRYGIPDFKLEKRVVERRVQLMRDEGVLFETGVEVGEDISYRYLMNRFDAVLLAGGAREPRDLPVPGRELDGIHYAMELLTQQNMLNGGETVDPARRIDAHDKRVIVIGGGDTGSDCIGTSWRQGAREVHQLEILPKPPQERSEATPWPMWPVKLRESSSHKEGGTRRWCVATREFTGTDGHVQALHGVEVEWSQGAGGRPVFKEKLGSEFVIETDLVLLAMGFVGPARNRIVEDLALDRDKRGFVARDANNMTSRAGIFVAGDMTQGASLVVRAIRDGQVAAEGIAAWLAGGGSIV